MPKAKKQLPPKLCAQCGTEFIPNVGQQRYCDIHKNRHGKQQQDRRQLGAKERPGYYRIRSCEECGKEYEPTSGIQKYCPEHRAGSWERHNRDKHLATARKAQRRYRHRKQFGDPDIYDTMIKRYGKRCAICGKEPDEGMYLAIDHCHATEQLRGLLCSRCNTGLGYFKDKPECLRAAADYLEGFRLLTVDEHC